jgi:hypothetical protein
LLCGLLVIALFFVIKLAIAGPLEDAVAANKAGDWVRAVQIWRQLAEQGDRRAQAMLGVMYDMGRGVPLDRVEGLKWTRRAAEQGDAGSQFALGSAYAAGEVVTRDWAEAAKWHRRAAEQDDPVSQLILGGHYAQGLGVQKDYVEAMKWLIISARTKLTSKKARTATRLPAF